jgi:hypothetical protein
MTTWLSWIGIGSNTTITTTFDDDKLPPFFPRTTKSCKSTSDKFFDCFSKASIKQSPNDTDAGSRGLAICLKEKQLYEKCMIAYEKSKPIKLHRVQEEYRKKNET